MRSSVSKQASRPFVLHTTNSGRSLGRENLSAGVRQKRAPFPPQALVDVADKSVEEKKLQPGLPHTGLGYSFTPGGLLIPYYVGAMQAMGDLNMIGDDTPVSGSSAGAIAAALLVSGLDLKDCLEITKKLHLEILENGTFQKLRDPLQRTLMDILPEDVHNRANGRVGIGVTIYRSMTSGPPVEGQLLDYFYDKEDFVDAVVASCYIPYYLGPEPGLQYRGEIYSDGLPTNFFPSIIPSAQEKLEKTITISAIPRANRFYRNGPGVDISPDNRPASERHSSWGYLQRALFAYPLDELEQLASTGYDEAKQWAEDFLQQRLKSSSNPAQESELSI